VPNLVSRLGRALLPERLGRDFRYLWYSSTIGNVGDGILLAAGPLLVASLTREPFPVAMAVLAQRLPWVLFGVFAGAVIDRLDRRRLIIVVDVLRALVLVLLTVIVATGHVNLATIYIAMFLIGTAESFADNAGMVYMAVVVPKAELGIANARMFGSHTVTNQLVGPPLGALLFTIGMALPFGVNAVCFLLSAAVIARMVPRPAPVRGAQAPSLRHEVAEGLRWLWSHPPVRTLAIMITIFNITFGASFSVLVLYAYERLGLDEFGFGLFLTVSAVGGLIGSGSFGFLERRFPYAVLLRVGLVIETLTHVCLALTSTPAVAALVMTVFGAHAVVWGTTSTTVRQRAVPERLLGRVTSVYMLGSIGAIAIGTVIGGAIAQRWGILAPFWFAAVGSAITTALIWRALTYVAHAAEVDDDESPDPPPTSTRPV
jgi:predicted MFS family arabinose efflux permease